MTEINSNQNLAELLIVHGISVSLDDEFIYTDLPLNVKFKSRITYNIIHDQVSSRLDVMAITGNNETIIESFGDVGINIEDAINRNFTNFSSSSLHVLLAAFGADTEELADQVIVEKWKIGEKSWTAYIGNILRKGYGLNLPDNTLTDQFWGIVEGGIKERQLDKSLHWFRGYYLQHKNAVVGTEFLMNNESLGNDSQIFSKLPLIPNIEYFSCRIFIILRAI